jgi:hypothetical protein
MGNNATKNSNKESNDTHQEQANISPHYRFRFFTLTPKLKRQPSEFGSQL